MSKYFNIDVDKIDTTDYVANAEALGHIIGDNADDLGRMRRYSRDDRKGFPLDEILGEPCRGIYLPKFLTIKANGEVATCPMVTAGEGFGNIHDKGLIDVLNDMHNSPLYKANVDDRIREYAAILDRNIFKEIRSYCAAQVIVSMAINEVSRLGKNPSDCSPVEIKTINERIAKYSGFL
jgi:hypothetical protein